MPELPEVETIRRVIGPQISGLMVEQVTVRRPEVIAHPAAEECERRLTGQCFRELARRGKYLVFQFSGGDRLLLHLRMTGCLLLTPAEAPEEPHTHVVFRLSDGRELRFSDTRRFGRFWLLREGETDTYSGAEKLGLEPSDSSLSAEYLSDQWGKSRKAIKTCLLDQTVIAGIGNIYSDEILYAAGIHPARQALCLTGEEWERLAAEIPKQLSYFIEKNAITPEDYLETRGKDYRNTPHLQVYGHEGEPCPSCGAPLCRRVIGGRGSVFCPRCQRE
ncbi:MAG: bifunctional DNA-formamidopyrimidine glycosylase/DNA-(apurinic or apyrimidinic site) lyase [Lachnospiraceae bacterium]|nr:bifunctional DNA-formamidopyrimidine glycosylase/DNA-(apurinic or apyrimidinic site) lyase [Lachnospiraceae bacterium]